MTQAEKAAAKVISEALDASERSQEDVAADVGVSQGQIAHWKNGRLPVPAKRAAPLAKALGVADPATISVEFAESVSRNLGWISTPPASTPGRITQDQLARQLLAKATPRSRRALQSIIDAAESGKLTDADIELLGSIARRFQE